MYACTVTNRLRSIQRSKEKSLTKGTIEKQKADSMWLPAFFNDALFDSLDTFRKSPCGGDLL